MTIRKVGIAVAGAGLIGLRHIEEIRKSRGATLAAIVDVSPKAAAIAHEVGVPLHGSLAELFAQSRPDGVIVATPNTLHDQGRERQAGGNRRPASAFREIGALRGAA